MTEINKRLFSLFGYLNNFIRDKPGKNNNWRIATGGFYLKYELLMKWQKNYLIKFHKCLINNYKVSDGKNASN